MSKSQKLMLSLQILVGLILSVFLVLSMGKRTIADEPDVSPDLTKPPKLIVIPPTGYKPRPASEESQKGEAEFKALNCIACHSIHNVGDTYAPALDGIGQRRSEEFLLSRLTDSPEARQKYASLVGAAAAENPHIRLTPQTARNITAFLLTVPEPAGGFVIMPHVLRLPVVETQVEKEERLTATFHPPAKSLSSEEGEKLYMKLGCVACHSIGKVGGWLAPRLDGIGSRHNRQYIVAHISNAKAEARESDIDAAQVSSEMPHFDVTPEQLQKIADYLMTLPSADKE